MPEDESTNTIVVGAGPAGLAVAACLRRAQVPFLILEQASQAGATWHLHYDRLHLHTDKHHSALPYLSFPSDYPRYPSRLQVVAYLEQYAEHFKLRPQFNERVCSASRSDGLWKVQTDDADYEATNLVIASGLNRVPNRPAWPGQDQYGGRILHSSDYRTGAPFAGQTILIAGLGNSGGEIAIDLYEHGAQPTLAVRSPVNIIPREILGVPFLYIAIPMRALPVRLADALAAPISALTAGNRRSLGLPAPAFGPNQQIRDAKKVPVIDVGTVRLIREGKIKIQPGIEHFTRQGVCFTNGAESDFSAVILATGYRAGVSAFLQGAEAALDEYGTPRHSGHASGVPGLYFCGFYVSPTGALREIAIESQQIAQAISSRHIGTSS